MCSERPHSSTSPRRGFSSVRVHRRGAAAAIGTSDAVWTSFGDLGHVLRRRDLWGVGLGHLSEATRRVWGHRSRGQAGSSVFELVGGPQVGLALGAFGQDRAPAARERGPLHRRDRAVAEVDDPAGAVDRAGQRRVEQAVGDRLGVGQALVEVVAGHQPGRHADAERLEQRVEPQVVAVLGAGARRSSGR